MTLEPHDVIFFESTAELRDWFDANHETAADLWLGYHRKATGKPTISWSDAVDEALCVGWIDGIRKRIDEASSAQRFTPRRKGSNWSAINVDKVAALTAEGRMRPAGLAAFEARSELKTGVYSYEQAEALFSADELATLSSRAGRLGRLGAAGALVPQGGHVLGDEREGRRHEGPTTRGAHRRLGGRRAGATDALEPGEGMTPEASAALDAALEALERLDLGDEFDPRAAAAIVDAGLHRLLVPAAEGGMGAGMVDAVEVLAAIGGVDGSTALGFAMHVHVTGAALQVAGWPDAARQRLVRAVLDEGALINATATEESGGSPSRGAIPGTLAEPDPAGGWRVTGEKTWTTWLPVLRLALVSARMGDGRSAGRRAAASSISNRPASFGRRGSRPSACAARRQGASDSMACTSPRMPWC